MTWVCAPEVGTFIHIPKCAGHGVMAQFPGKFYQSGWMHQRRSQVIADRTWTIVRHPFTRLVSYWLFEKRKKRTELDCIDWLHNRRPKTMDWYLDAPVDLILRFESLPNHWPKSNVGEWDFIELYSCNSDIQQCIIDLYQVDFERFEYERTLDREVQARQSGRVCVQR